MKHPVKHLVKHFVKHRVKHCVKHVVKHCVKHVVKHCVKHVVKHFLCIFTLASLFATASFAQIGIEFSDDLYDPNAETVFIADSMEGDAQAGVLVLLGGAEIGQGALRVSADKISASFDTDTDQITDIQAEGRVFFTTGSETAEAESAHINVGSETVTLTGNVLVVQGNTVFSGDVLRADSQTRRAVMSGNVKIVVNAAEVKE